jgi:hypothetical protein
MVTYQACLRAGESEQRRPGVTEESRSLVDDEVVDRWRAAGILLEGAARELFWMTRRRRHKR